MIKVCILRLASFMLLGVSRKKYLLVAIGSKTRSKELRLWQQKSAGFRLKGVVIAFILFHPFPPGSFSTSATVSLDATDLFLTSHWPDCFAVYHWLQVLEVVNGRRLTETCLTYSAACHPLLCIASLFLGLGKMLTMHVLHAVLGIPNTRWISRLELATTVPQCYTFVKPKLHSSL